MHPLPLWNGGVRRRPLLPLLLLAGRAAWCTVAGAVAGAVAGTDIKVEMATGAGAEPEANTKGR